MVEDKRGRGAARASFAVTTKHGEEECEGGANKSESKEGQRGGRQHRGGTRGR